MYTKGFFITEPVGNNAFSFSIRTNKKIWVSPVKNIQSFDEIELQDDVEKVAFEDISFDGDLRAFFGLKNFYRICCGGKEIILFDNHNHALYFWYEALLQGKISKHSTLIHIDEHADTRDPEVEITQDMAQNLASMFHFTNFQVNVGNYIIPAQKEGLIGEIIQVRNTTNLEQYLKHPPGKGESIILNLDLDFFQPDLDFIDYNLKKRVVQDAFQRADVVTICTSPLFIDQKLAIKIFRDIFEEFL